MACNLINRLLSINLIGLLQLLTELRFVPLRITMTIENMELIMAVALNNLRIDTNISESLGLPKNLYG